jgi:hypothetical protein
MPIIGNPIYQSAFVVDQFSGNGSTTAFTMSVAPAGVTNVLVAVSGVLQDPSTYGVVGNTITFSAAPPSGTGNISCRYLGVPVTGVTTTAYRTVTEFTATASQTTFTPPSYSVGFINVYLNGVLLGSADYTATNGTTVVLAVGASAGNLLTVESFQISSVLNAIANAAGSVSSSNIADNAITTSKIAPGAVIPADLSTGGPSWASNGNLTTTGSITVGSITQSGGLANSRLKVKQTANTNLYYGMQLEAEGSDTSLFIANNDSAFNVVATYGSTGSYQPITMWTGGLERMRIDASGRVTTPSQPAFRATKNNGSGSSGASTTIVFNQVNTNIGSCYNNSTGFFTAPVAGMYQLNFTGITNNASTDAAIQVNGNAVCWTYCYFSQTYANMSMSVATYMNAGDAAKVFIYAGNLYDGGDGGAARFSGFLIG